MISEDNIAKENRTYEFACNKFSPDKQGRLVSEDVKLKLTANEDIESHIGTIYDFADNPELIAPYAKEMIELSEKRLTKSAIERRTGKKQARQVAEK